MTECFKIRLFSCDFVNFGSLDLSHPIYEVPCASKWWTANPIDIMADPFLFVHNDKLYLFYESKRFRQNAVIDMVWTMDLQTWSEPVTVLQESFHLSYPFVFEDHEHFYMIPETCSDHSIRLYEADDDSLTHFSLKTKLIENDDKVEIDFSDSSIYIKDNTYYLHTTICKEGINHLLLYYSPSLEGPYLEHPSSPISISQKYGRNAGCLLQVDNKLYRVAQDCVNRYGDNVHLLAIDELTKNYYKEHKLKDCLYDTKTAFYKEGGHQLNIVRFLDKYIIATDAKEYHNFLISRILFKIKNI